MVSQLLIFVPSLSFDCLQGIKYTNVQISFHRYDRWRVYYTTKWLEYEVRSENHRTFWITQQRNVLVARGWQYCVYHIIIYCYLSTTCLTVHCRCYNVRFTKGMMQRESSWVYCYGTGTKDQSSKWKNQMTDFLQPPYSPGLACRDFFFF